MVAPLVFLGTHRLALVVLMPALFLGFFAHVTSLVSYTVVGTSGLPNEEQGLPTGLTSMTQQVALTIGAPVMVSIAASQSSTLTGTHLALGLNAAVTVVCAIAIWFGLRTPKSTRYESPSRPSSVAMSSERVSNWSG